MNSANIARIWRAIDRLVLLGTVAEVDLATARARIEYDRVGETPVVTDWLPWLAAAGTTRSWRPPSVGEQVAVLCPDGDPRRGIVIGGIYSAQHAAPSNDACEARIEFEDGAVVAYDAATHKLAATLPSGGEAEITAPGGVTITGDLTVTGDVTATGDVSDGGTMAAMRSTYNAHTHSATNVPPGGPLPQM